MKTTPPGTFEFGHEKAVEKVVRAHGNVAGHMDVNAMMERLGRNGSGPVAMPGAAQPEKNQSFMGKS
ncbi:hypothetical protein E1293_27720 [Actinomadura darangshiensis]|uniref:Uncharacterized protein n=1 Tax=Actinomadura darangshiensis TaxID=705336 RepID=A0A4R5AVT4_9ACTN|nr:hypothetical protein [Actinomadura darangshiensis]TDD75816.1 hypothetical protein E1293_27720 [Actinomadura darangshiensis]